MQSNRSLKRIGPTCVDDRRETQRADKQRTEHVSARLNVAREESPPVGQLAAQASVCEAQAAFAELQCTHRSPLVKGSLRMTSSEFLLGVIRLVIIAAVLAGLWWAWPKGGPFSRF